MPALKQLEADYIQMNVEVEEAARLPGVALTDVLRQKPKGQPEHSIPKVWKYPAAADLLAEEGQTLPEEDYSVMMGGEHM